MGSLVFLVLFWSEVIYALVADLCQFFFVSTASRPKRGSLFASGSLLLRVAGGIIRLFIYGVIDAVLPVDTMTVARHIYVCLSVNYADFLLLVSAVALNTMFSVCLPLIWSSLSAETPPKPKHIPKRHFSLFTNSALFNNLLSFPLLEELFYRHFLHRRLSIQTHPLVAYVVVPIWMALNHQPATTPQNIVRIFRAFIYCLLYEHSNHIIILPIVAHMANNIIALFVDSV